MSGAEAIAVLGVVSSIIAIVDGTKKVYDAAKDARGLPEAFREVAGRLPIVESTLSTVESHIKGKIVDEDACRAVKSVAEACETKTKKLGDIFQKALPREEASDLKRYYRAVKAYGKGNEVEILMKGILEDLQLLACEHGMRTATLAEQEQIVEAMKKMSTIPPSTSDESAEETGFLNSNLGSGTQYNAQGGNVAQGNARQYISGGGAMHFGTE